MTDPTLYILAALVVIYQLPVLIIYILKKKSSPKFLPIVNGTFIIYAIIFFIMVVLSQVMHPLVEDPMFPNTEEQLSGGIIITYIVLMIIIILPLFLIIHAYYYIIDRYFKKPAV